LEKKKLNDCANFFVAFEFSKANWFGAPIQISRKMLNFPFAKNIVPKFAAGCYAYDKSFFKITLQTLFLCFLQQTYENLLDVKHLLRQILAFLPLKDT